MLGQSGEPRRRTVEIGVPGDEVQEIVAVAAAGCCRQVVGRQTIKETLQPGGWVGPSSWTSIVLHAIVTPRIETLIMACNAVFRDRMRRAFHIELSRYRGSIGHQHHLPVSTR